MRLVFLGVQSKDTDIPPHGTHVRNVLQHSPSDRVVETLKFVHRSLWQQVDPGFRRGEGVMFWIYVKYLKVVLL